MASMSTTEVVGFCENVIKFMQDNQAALETAGVTAANWLTELDEQKQDAVAKNIEQEMLKAQLKTTTAQTQAALREAYASTSSKLDAMIGALGKGTPLAKQAARLRSNVRSTKRSATSTSKRAK